MNKPGDMDKIHGYAIQKTVLFENGAGVALGENPNAPNPYVTWRFQQENGTRDYFWGHYHNTREAAEANFTDRAANYKQLYQVREVAPQKQSVRAKLMQTASTTEGRSKDLPSKNIHHGHDR